LLGFALRFYWLGQVPAGFLSDEAAVGYNAYSLIKTGRDEFGQSWPLFFRSFGEGKLTLYVYEAVLPVLVFGLNQFSVRFMPAFLGSLTVGIIYLLTKELLQKKPLPRERIALLASFSLAVMPWHIHFCRGVFGQESLFWTALGSWLFLLGRRREKPFLTLAAFFSFTASLLTYHAARVFTPLWLMFLLVFCWQKTSRKRNLMKIILFSVLIIIPSVLIVKSSVGGARGGGISLFHSQSGVQIKLQESIMECRDKPFWLIRLFHNKLESYLRDLGQRYFSHFNPDFLFFSGDPLRPRYRVPHVGQLLLVQAPFFLVGIYLFFQLKLWPVSAWLALGPLPAAITFETPSSVRAIFMTLPLAWAVSLGINWFYGLFARKRKFLLAVFLVLIVFFSWSFGYYLDAYYVHQEVHQPYYWQYGYRQLVARINELEADYQRVEITDARGNPYIFFLFYNRYDPVKFQSEVWDNWEPAQKFSFEAIRKLGEKLYFVNQLCPAEKGAEEGVLYVCTQEHHPREEIKKGKVRVLETIDYQDGQEAFVLMEKVKGEADGKAVK